MYWEFAVQNLTEEEQLQLALEQSMMGSRDDHMHVEDSSDDDRDDDYNSDDEENSDADDDYILDAAATTSAPAAPSAPPKVGGRGVSKGNGTQALRHHEQCVQSIIGKIWHSGIAASWTMRTEHHL
jgi:hypothetical protein